MGSDVDVFATSGFFDRARLPFIGLWSAAGDRLLGSTGYDDSTLRLGSWAIDSHRRRFVYTVVEGQHVVVDGERQDVRSSTFVDSLGFDGDVARLGSPDVTISETHPWARQVAVDPLRGRFLVAVAGSEVVIIDIREGELAEPRRLGSRVESAVHVTIDEMGTTYGVLDESGEIQIGPTSGDAPSTAIWGHNLFGPGFSPERSWLQISGEDNLLIVWTRSDVDLTARVVSLESNPPRLVRTVDLGVSGRGTWRYDHVGDTFVKAGPEVDIRLWPIREPADAEPLHLHRGGVETLWDYSVHPDSKWLASADVSGLALWPLARSYPIVIRGHRKKVNCLQFDPNGAWLASSSMDDTTRLWPLEGSVPSAGRVLFEDPSVQMWILNVTPDGQRFLVGTSWSGVRSFSLSGQEIEKVPRIGPTVIHSTISSDGRLGAAVEGWGADLKIHVWDFESGQILKTFPAPGRWYGGIEFTADGHLLTSCELGVRRWDIETSDSDLLLSGHMRAMSVSEDGTEIVVIEVVDGAGAAGRSGEPGGRRRVLYLDVESGESRPLPGQGVTTTAVAVDFEKDLAVTGDRDGVVRVGRLSRDEPFLCFGHENLVVDVAIDPLGRWIASGGQDTTVRLWPMPDLSKPPLHTLPREELIAKLKTLTNLRVVRDEDSATGWRLTHDPFPGWETVPTG
jgi:WD40 repeat protein